MTTAAPTPAFNFVPLENPTPAAVAKRPYLSMVGDVYRVLATKAETGGAFTLVEALIYPGGGPPMHSHRTEDEGFYILEGSLWMVCDGKELTATPGQFVYLPKGSKHCFKNKGETLCRALVWVTPGGIDEYFAQCADVLPEGQITPLPFSPQGAHKLVSLGDKYGIDFHF